MHNLIKIHRKVLNKNAKYSMIKEMENLKTFSFMTLIDMNQLIVIKKDIL